MKGDLISNNPHKISFRNRFINTKYTKNINNEPCDLPHVTTYWNKIRSQQIFKALSNPPPRNVSFTRVKIRASFVQSFRRIETIGRSRSVRDVKYFNEQWFNFRRIYVQVTIYYFFVEFVEVWYFLYQFEESGFRLASGVHALQVSPQ